MGEDKSNAPLKYEQTAGYWNKVWSKFRYDDRKDVLTSMADRINSRDYWDNIWKNPGRRVEKYSMQRAWWCIAREGAKSVLDVGCGNGRLLFPIKDKCEVFGIDISQVAIDRMKNEYGVEGAVMDAYDVDKLERTFDFIVANHMLEHLYRDEEFVIKCKARLNPNGTFFCAVPNNMSGPEETEEHVRKYDQKMIEDLLNKVFGNCEIQIIGNHLIGIAKKC